VVDVGKFEVGMAQCLWKLSFM